MAENELNRSQSEDTSDSSGVGAADGKLSCAQTHVLIFVNSRILCNVVKWEVLWL